MHRVRSLVVVASSLAILAAACSSDGDKAATSTSTPPSAASIAPPATEADTTSTPAPTITEAPTTTTIDPATLAHAYEEPGPNPVGVTTAQLANGINVEIWYPAVPGSSGTETYDVRDFTAPSIKALLTADIPATFSYAATRDAAVADGSFPVVLNSHGFSGIRVGSSFLTSHLASWGMIVVSPDHPSRDLYHVVAGVKPDVETTPVDDLLGSLDLITVKGSTAGDPFDGHVDTSRVGALGHSAGGGTVLQAAADPRITGYVSMASGFLGSRSSSTANSTTPPSAPDKPSFFLSGSADQVAPSTVSHDAYLAVPAPSLYWQIDGVGHNGFDDFCTFGNGKGIIGLAEASGLGAFLDSQPQFRALGEDGCLPPDVPVATTFPIIDHAVTAWFQALFGVDAVPKGLGPEVAGEYAQPVTIEVKH